MPITIYPGTVKKRNSNGTYSDLVPGAGANAQLAGDIAEEYDSTSGVYSVDDYCLYQSVLYRCTTAISTPEAFDSLKWSEVNVGDELSGVKNTLNQLDQNMAYVESGNTASRTYAKGDFISWKGTLYTASTAIPATTAFAVGTNLAAVVDGNNALCGGLNSLKTSFESRLSFSTNGKLTIDGTITGKTFASYFSDMKLNECRVFCFYNMTNNEKIGTIGGGVCIAVRAGGYSSNVVQCIACSGTTIETASKSLA